MYRFQRKRYTRGKNSIVKDIQEDKNENIQEKTREKKSELIGTGEHKHVEIQQKKGENKKIVDKVIQTRNYCTREKK